ncbi:MAG: hypothetical protein OK436_06245 [Thaumarchaeota archaeon]|nr:hypothetical protein [Nitrososphaerota archaeon]
MKKGNLMEKQVVEYLQAHGFPSARRLGQQGAKDKGDVGGLGVPVTLEIKNCVKLALGQWMGELESEMFNSDHSIGAVIHKRVGKGDPGLQYVTMDLLSFVQLLEWMKVDG